MVKYLNEGNLFKSNADALVNPVNCKGVMGKGIALQYKSKYPECFVLYKKACDKNILKPGKLLFVRINKQADLFIKNNNYIILFPTKNHWIGKSKIKWIEDGLKYLKQNYKKYYLKSIAMPQIGCGLGGLKWEEVKQIIEKYFAKEEVVIEIYMSAIREYEN